MLENSSGDPATADLFSDLVQLGDEVLRLLPDVGDLLRSTPRAGARHAAVMS